MNKRTWRELLKPYLWVEVRLGKDLMLSDRIRVYKNGDIRIWLRWTVAVVEAM